MNRVEEMVDLLEGAGFTDMDINRAVLQATTLMLVDIATNNPELSEQWLDAIKRSAHTLAEIQGQDFMQTP